MSRPDISAVICTFNRAGYLERSLGSLLRQRLPRERFEVLLMDNNSTDQTRTVAEQFLERFPHSLPVVEKQGLAHARNVALREACAPVIAYLETKLPPRRTGCRISFIGSKHRPPRLRRRTSLSGLGRGGHGYRTDISTCIPISISAQR
jgi:hypothetical protein